MNITIRLTKVEYEMLKELQKRDKRYRKGLEDKVTSIRCWKSVFLPPLQDKLFPPFKELGSPTRNLPRDLCFCFPNIQNRNGFIFYILLQSL